MARVRLTRQRVKRAFLLIPAMAVLGALLWPAGAVRPGPTLVSAACPIPGIICDSPTPTPPKPSPTPPKPSPTATPTHRPPPPPPPPSSPIPVVPPSSGNTTGAIGAAPGPPAPPSVTATNISMASEPANPDPGTDAILVITVSGQNGADKYGVSGINVDVALKQSPGRDAKLDANTVTTDASGAATVKLTLSQTRGRHVVAAAATGLSTDWATDTLAGANLVSRARHGGEIDVVPVAATNNAAIFFVGAGFIFVLGFAWPYFRSQWKSRGWHLPVSMGRVGLRTSSKRTS